jgi:hypothetical protein
MSLKFLGHFVLFVKKIWDGLPVPKRYSVLGALCPQDRSNQGCYVLGRFIRGHFVKVPSLHTVYCIYIYICMYTYITL